MPTVRLAEMTVGGTKLLVLPIDFDSGLETDSDRQVARDELQERAKNAGLSGVVIIVWKKAFGDTEFIAPPELNDAVSKLKFDEIKAALNTKLCWE